MTPISDAFSEFSAYQLQNNNKKYARVSSYRCREFLDVCADSGIEFIEQISEKHIRDYLKRTPKRQFPGAWRSRYTIIKTFFNYMVFIRMLKPSENPMGGTPTGGSLTNKATLSKLDVEKLMLVIPKDHIGLQDQLCCRIIWAGYSLKRINELTMKDVQKFPGEVRELAESLISSRGYIKSESLLITQGGQPQHLYGQKFNRRLQKYARLAELVDASRVTSSLLYQSGTYNRLGNPKSEFTSP